MINEEKMTIRWVHSLIITIGVFCALLTAWLGYDIVEGQMLFTAIIPIVGILYLAYLLPRTTWAIDVYTVFIYIETIIITILLYFNAHHWWVYSVFSIGVAILIWIPVMEFESLNMSWLHNTMITIGVFCALLTAWLGYDIVEGQMLFTAIIPTIGILYLFNLLMGANLDDETVLNRYANFVYIETFLIVILLYFNIHHVWIYFVFSIGIADSIWWVIRWAGELSMSWIHSILITLGVTFVLLTAWLGYDIGEGQMLFTAIIPSIWILFILSSISMSEDFMDAYSAFIYIETLMIVMLLYFNIGHGWIYFAFFGPFAIPAGLLVLSLFWSEGGGGYTVIAVKKN